VFRGTFLCFHRGVAEDARLFGHLVDELTCEAGMLGPGPYYLTALRGVAADLYHLDRFIAAARLDLARARQRIASVARLIAEGLEEDIRPTLPRTVFREVFLSRLSDDAQRAARSLGAHLYAKLAEPFFEQRPREARQGAAAELGFFAEHLAEQAHDLLHFFPNENEIRVGRFVDRVAKRLEALARTVGKEPSKARQGDA
jgi:hypothetical protein